MKKNLIASAVALALAAPATAFADTTLYGKIHTSLDSLDNGSDSAIYLSSNSSRLGVKGSEDLGNGLTVLYQLEGGIDWDGGGSWGATRNTFIGLKGSGGTVLAGRHDTPFKNLGGMVDFFGDQVGDNGNIVGKGHLGDSWDNRLSNVVAYVSPDMSGLQGSIAYMVDEGTDADALSAALNINSGGLKAGIAYETHNDDSKTADESAWRLAAGYSFGGVELAGMYQSIADAGYAKGNDYNAWGIGGAVKISHATKLKLQYYTVDDLSQTTDTGASLWAVGVDHKVSKRTSVYAVYGATNNDSAAKFVPYADGRNAKPSAAAGEDASGFSLGVVHNF